MRTQLRRTLTLLLGENDAEKGVERKEDGSAHTSQEHDPEHHIAGNDTRSPDVGDRKLTPANEAVSDSRRDQQRDREVHCDCRKPAPIE